MRLSGVDESSARSPYDLVSICPRVFFTPGKIGFLVPGYFSPQEKLGFWSLGNFHHREIWVFGPREFHHREIWVFGPREISPQGNLGPWEIWVFWSPGDHCPNDHCPRENWVGVSGGLTSISEIWGFLVFWDTLISWGIFSSNGGICLLLMLPEGDYNSYVTRKGLQFSTLKSKKADLFFFELVQKRSYKIENFYPLSLSIYDSKIYNFLKNWFFLC